ncbi:taste receptor type 2 member 40-like [Bufo gargarizans]|uniref:taste receptor type 2 member 40-like n=1 Tax=Bufo gargarizans TaxID=30331 RepID=UPI001CF5C288|nr:taste receptor type 2 member 40-like [Bufo gargarizans]
MAFNDHDTQDIMNPLDFYLSVVTILIIASILCNGFIVTVNIMDWLKGKLLNPVDQILVALSISNTGLSYSFWNYIFFIYFWPQFFFMDYVFPIVFTVMLFMTVSSSWLTAWLCLYFFAKIIHFKSSYLVKLKLTIDVAVPWLIVFSEVVAFSSSLPLVWTIFRSLPLNSTSHNQTRPVVSFHINSMYNVFVLGFSSNSCFVIVLVSTICIVWSLCRHTYRMKKTMSSEEYFRIRTHRRAAQTVVSLLLIYITFYVTYILMMSFFSSYNMSIYYWITVWVALSTSPAMSMVFILGNSKLRLVFDKIFCSSPPLD